MIIANQTLHGYANGHQMIASSCEWDLNDRKKMDVLSDLNSRCDDERLSYYMGYSISNGKNYVIAKTWYAGEMSRPGCVWTHSLILKTEDISKIKKIEEIITVFQRPDNYDFKRYSNIIEFEEMDKFESYCPNERLEYLIYTIYGTGNPRIVTFDDCGIETIKQLLYCIRNMPSALLKEFSFTTMTYEARTYNRKLFMYQVTTENLAGNIKRRNPQMEICVPYKSIEKMPYWVRCFNEYLKNNAIKNLYNFVESYGEPYFKWAYFNGFIRIFFLLQSNKELQLVEYFRVLSQVIENRADELIQRTIDLLLEEKFSAYVFKNVEYQILENIDLGIFKLSKKQNIHLFDKIMSGQLEYLYPLLCRYKEGKLKAKSQEFLNKIVLALKVSDFKRVSHMDEDICIILVHMNHDLLLSEDIWKSNRDFQVTMLYAAGKWKDSLRVNKLLKLIIHDYKANVVDELYSIYGNEIIPSALEIIKDEPIENWNALSQWYVILKKEPIELINCLCSFKSREVCRNLFCMMDLRNQEISKKIETNIWEKLFDKIIIKENEKLWLEKICLQYVVIIFTIEYHFSNELVERVLRPIYNSIMENKMGAKEWYYFQYLLPEVEACYSWDKCLRIREALNIRGYKIKNINA